METSIPPETPTPAPAIAEPAPVTPRVTLKPIYGALILIAGVLVGVGGFAAYREYRNVSVATFDECVKAAGSKMTLMYPGTCTTRDGKTFTQPLSDEERERLRPPAAETPIATPSDQSSVRTLSYSLPSGWETITDSEETIEAGYDPRTMSAQASTDEGLVIHSPATPNYTNRIITITRKRYDGGSRHAFILEPAGTMQDDEKLPTYHENEYLIGGKNCLFLIGLSVSMSPPVWGMCPRSDTEAYFITSYAKSDTELEAMLQTLRYIKSR